MLALAVLLAFWLSSSFAVAYRLTRRPQPRFAEPEPTVDWGQVEPHCLQTTDGQKIGAWLVDISGDALVVLLIHGIGASRSA